MVFLLPVSNHILLSCSLRRLLLSPLVASVALGAIPVVDCVLVGLGYLELGLLFSIAWYQVSGWNEFRDSGGVQLALAFSIGVSDSNARLIQCCLVSQIYCRSVFSRPD